MSFDISDFKDPSLQWVANKSKINLYPKNKAESRSSIKNEETISTSNAVNINNNVTQKAFEQKNKDKHSQDFVIKSFATKKLLDFNSNTLDKKSDLYDEQSVLNRHNRDSSRYSINKERHNSVDKKEVNYEYSKSSDINMTSDVIEQNKKSDNNIRDSKYSYMEEYKSRNKQSDNLQEFKSRNKESDTIQESRFINKESNNLQESRSQKKESEKSFRDYNSRNKESDNIQESRSRNKESDNIQESRSRNKESDNIQESRYRNKESDNIQESRSRNKESDNIRESRSRNKESDNIQESRSRNKESDNIRESRSRNKESDNIRESRPQNKESDNIRESRSRNKESDDRAQNKESCSLQESRSEPRESDFIQKFDKTRYNYSKEISKTSNNLEVDDYNTKEKLYNGIVVSNLLVDKTNKKLDDFDDKRDNYSRELTSKFKESDTFNRESNNFSKKNNNNHLSDRYTESNNKDSDTYKKIEIKRNESNSSLDEDNKNIKDELESNKNWTKNIEKLNKSSNKISLESNLYKKNKSLEPNSSEVLDEDRVFTKIRNKIVIASIKIPENKKEDIPPPPWCNKNPIVRPSAFSCKLNESVKYSEKKKTEINNFDKSHKLETERKTSPSRKSNSMILDEDKLILKDSWAEEKERSRQAQWQKVCDIAKKNEFALFSYIGPKSSSVDLHLQEMEFTKQLNEQNFVKSFTNKNKLYSGIAEIALKHNLLNPFGFQLENMTQVVKNTLHEDRGFIKKAFEDEGSEYSSNPTMDVYIHLATNLINLHLQNSEEKSVLYEQEKKKKNEEEKIERKKFEEETAKAEQSYMMRYYLQNPQMYYQQQQPYMDQQQQQIYNQQYMYYQQSQNGLVDQFQPGLRQMNTAPEQYYQQQQQQQQQTNMNQQQQQQQTNMNQQQQQTNMNQQQQQINMNQQQQQTNMNQQQQQNNVNQQQQQQQINMNQQQQQTNINQQQQTNMNQQQQQANVSQQQQLSQFSVQQDKQNQEDSLTQVQLLNNNYQLSPNKLGEQVNYNRNLGENQKADTNEQKETKKDMLLPASLPTRRNRTIEKNIRTDDINASKSDSSGGGDGMMDIISTAFKFI